MKSGRTDALKPAELGLSYKAIKYGVAGPRRASYPRIIATQLTTQQHAHYPTAFPESDALVHPGLVEEL